MTNISKHNLTAPDYKIAETQLTQLIGKLNKSKAHHLFENLLTDTERIMITKRFAAALMFSQNYSPYRVSLILDLSFSTGQRINAQYKRTFSFLFAFKRPYPCTSQPTCAGPTI
jgi:histidinol dehydrogenase